MKMLEKPETNRADRIVVTSDLHDLYEHCHSRVVDGMLALVEAWGVSPTQSPDTLDRVAQRVRALRDDLDILRHVVAVMERRATDEGVFAMPVEAQGHASQDLPDPSVARSRVDI